MTPVEHSALIEDARRRQAMKAQETVQAVAMFKLWDAQRREMNLMFQRYVLKDPFAIWNPSA